MMVVREKSGEGSGWVVLGSGAFCRLVHFADTHGYQRIREFGELANSVLHLD